MSNRHFNPIIATALIALLGWALTLEITPMPVWKQMEIRRITPQIYSFTPEQALRVGAFTLIGFVRK